MLANVTNQPLASQAGVAVHAGRLRGQSGPKRSYVAWQQVRRDSHSGVSWPRLPTIRSITPGVSAFALVAVREARWAHARHTSQGRGVARKFIVLAASGLLVAVCH